MQAAYIDVNMQNDVENENGAQNGNNRFRAAGNRVVNHQQQHNQHGNQDEHLRQRYAAARQNNFRRRIYPRRHRVSPDTEVEERSHRKNNTVRIDFDRREEACWDNLIKELEADSCKIVSPLSGGPDVYIPTESEIQSLIRKNEQREAILRTRDILNSPGASDIDIRDALERLEIHISSNQFEYQMIEEATNNLIEASNEIRSKLNDLDSFMSQIQTIINK